MTTPAYGAYAPDNQAPALSWWVLQKLAYWLILFPAASWGWGLAVYLMWEKPLPERIGGLILLALSLGFLIWRVRQDEDKADRIARYFVPGLSEWLRYHRLQAKKRANKYLPLIWSGIKSELPLKSYLWRTNYGYDWYIPGHPAIGDLEKARAALFNALGLLEEELNIHDFKLERAPGQQQQYIARLYYHKLADPLDEDRASTDQRESTGSMIFGIEEDITDDH